MRLAGRATAYFERFLIAAENLGIVKRREAVCRGSLPRAKRRFCSSCNPSEERYPSSRRGRQRRYGSLLHSGVPDRGYPSSAFT